MSNVYPLLLKLTANRQFINDFVAAKDQCFALGVIEERKQLLGLLALRPSKIIPSEIMNAGVNVGHSLLGNTNFEVVHFAFEFYGFGTYNVLVNPNNPLAQAVLRLMIDSGEYFFLAIVPDQGVTAFRSTMGRESLAGLKNNLARIQHSTTDDVQYQRAVRQFQQHPTPPGQLLNWVCRDNVGYLDLTSDRLDMRPAALRAGAISSSEDASRIAEQRAIAELLDGKFNDLVRAGVGDDLMLMAHMAPEMPLFKRLMDLSGEGGVSALCGAYPGLYRFAKLLEMIAAGIRSGDIEVPR